MNLKLFQTRLDEQHLQADQDTINRFMEKVYVRKTATQFVPGEPDYWSVMVFYEDEKPKKSHAKDSDKISVQSESDLTEEEREIVSALKQWRKDKASALNVPDFFICHNADLFSLSRAKPRTLADFGKVKGFGDQKIARHGEEIISVINAF